MVGENKFFFEEDTESESVTGVSLEEQADLFGEAVAEVGIKSDLDSMAPLSAEVPVMTLVQRPTPMLLIEHGIVDKDYVLHVTPVHPQRNLKPKGKLNAALKAIILAMNTKVPFDLKVDIHLPQEDWDVKALSFIIRGGAEAWNFDMVDFDSTVIPEIEKQLTEICVKL